MRRSAASILARLGALVLFLAEIKRCKTNSRNAARAAYARCKAPVWVTAASFARVHAGKRKLLWLSGRAPAPALARYAGGSGRPTRYKVQDSRKLCPRRRLRRGQSLRLSCTL